MKKFLLTMLAAFILGMAPLLAQGLDQTAEVVITTKGMTGQCSGFHIGEGRIITARHCFSEKFRTRKDLSIFADGHPAVFNWIEDKLDVVELYAEGRKGSPAARLSCVTPLPGSTVEARGTPSEEFGLFRTWGRIATSPRSFFIWGSIVIHTAVIVPGSSGGPLYNEGGEVIAVNVGGLRGQSAYYSVPLEAFCDRVVKAPI